MILHGSQRGGSKDLARHLLKDENDEVWVHQIKGFMSDDLESAFKEAYVVSKGTRCRQFLYSLSLNPPKGEDVSTEDFEQAVDRAEKKLGLDGQPRAIVLHTKGGRTHAHAVWSRIKADEMKAVQLSHTKHKLKDLSRELFLENPTWNMPLGYARSQDRDPTCYSLDEWQQAKRAGKDPRETKAVFLDCWAMSDSQEAYRQALKSKGYTLARGDRRGFVALDHTGEVFAVSRWSNLKAKEVRAKLTNSDILPSVDEARKKIAKEMEANLLRLKKQQEEKAIQRQRALEYKRIQLTKQQLKESNAQQAQHEKRQRLEQAERDDRFRKGLPGLLDRVTGKHRRTKEQNQHEAAQSEVRDTEERQVLEQQQAQQKQVVQTKQKRVSKVQQLRQAMLEADAAQYRDMRSGKSAVARFKEQARSDRSREGPELER